MTISKSTILILNDMPMPRDCSQCKLCLSEFESNLICKCIPTGKIVVINNMLDRPTWCPLIDGKKYTVVSTDEWEHYQNEHGTREDNDALSH